MKALSRRCTGRIEQQGHVCVRNPDDPIIEIEKDLERFIPDATRLMMLDLVMIWARVDTGIGQLASTIFGMRPSIGAVIFNRMRVQDRLMRLRDLCVQMEHEEGAKHFRQMKKEYEKHSKPRNLIAHAACIGITRSNPVSLVFLPFEAEGPYGNLAVEQVNLEIIAQSIEWGKRIESEVIAQLSESEFWERHD